MRLLFVYGFEPSGHASAAAALERAAQARSHWTGRIAVSSYHPVIGRLVAAGYLGIIRNIPGFWRFLYDDERIVAPVRLLRRLYLFFGGRRIGREIAGLNPDVIICTHAVALGFLLDVRAAGAFACPIVAVLTDFGVHGYWTPPRADLYFTASEDAARLLAARGVAGEAILALGIPIHPAFEDPVERNALRRGLGASEETRVVLLAGGSRGLGRLPGMTRAILGKLGGVLLVAVCGNNAGLRGELQAAYAGDRRLRALGVQTPGQMRDLIGACDLVIGKAGGLTSAEALALGAPLMLVDSIPGQEERNAVYLEEKGAAVRARGPRGLGGEVKALLEDGSRLEALRRAAAALGRPRAAKEIIGAIEKRFSGLSGRS